MTGKELIISSLARVQCTLFIKPVGEAAEDGFTVCSTVLVVGLNVVVINVVGTTVVVAVDAVTISVLATVVGAIVMASVDAITEDDTNAVLVVIVVEVRIDIGGIVDVDSKIKILVMSCKSFPKNEMIMNAFDSSVKTFF